MTEQERKPGTLIGEEWALRKPDLSMHSWTLQPNAQSFCRECGLYYWDIVKQYINGCYPPDPEQDLDPYHDAGYRIT